MTQRSAVAHLSFIAVLVLLACVLVHRAEQVATTQPTDLTVWYDASHRAARGADPYADVRGRYPYLYPPLFLCLFEPFTHLEYPDAVRAWAAVSVGAWLLLIAISLRTAFPSGRPVPIGACWLVALVPFRWVLNLLMHGQVDLVVALLVVLSLACHARARDLAAGFCLALAIAIKLLPAIFLAHYALRGRWRVAGAALACGAILFVAPAARYGPARFVELLDEWRHGPLAGEIRNPASDAQESNQGLAATLYRYALPAPLPPPEDQAPALFHLSAGEVTLFYATAALLVLAVWARALSATAADRSVDALALALTFAVQHLVVRRSWGYHYVTMTFVVAALLGALAVPDLAPRRRTLLRTALLSCAFLQNFYSPMIVGKELSCTISSYGPTTLSFLLLVLCLSRALSASP